MVGIRRTILIPKTEPPCSNPERYRPITCLNIMYKLLTGALCEIIRQHLDAYDLLPQEQRAIKRGRAGCMEALMIDSMVIEHSELYDTPLSMAWVDYRKAYDSVSHKWLKRMLKDLHIPKSVRICIKKLTNKWETSLSVGDKQSTKMIKYKRGVFQGDSLSPLLCLAPVSHVLEREAGYLSTPTTSITHTFFMDDLKVYSGGEQELTHIPWQ